MQTIQGLRGKVGMGLPSSWPQETGKQQQTIGQSTKVIPQVQSHLETSAPEVSTKDHESPLQDREGSVGAGRGSEDIGMSRMGARSYTYSAGYRPLEK